MASYCIKKECMREFTSIKSIRKYSSKSTDGFEGDFIKEIEAQNMLF